MADTKTSAESSGAPALAGDLVRIARGGGNFKLTLSELLTFIGTVASADVATTQAAAGGNTLTPGSWRRITNAYGGRCDLYIRVKPGSTSELEPVGFGTFEGTAMSGPVFFSEIHYNLASDYVTVLAHDVNNNILIQSTGNTFDKYEIDLETSGGLSLFRNNRLTNITGTWLARHTICVNVTASNSSISTNKVGTVDDVALGLQNSSGVEGQLIIRDGSTIAVVSDSGNYIFTTLDASAFTIGAILSGEVGSGCNINAVATDLRSIELGDGKFIATGDIATGYVGAGGTWRGNKSTFYMSASFNSAINPDAGGVMNLANVEWVGVLEVTDTTNPLNQISGGFAGLHDAIIFPSSGAGAPLIINDAVGVGGGANIYLWTDPVTLDETKGQFITLGGHVQGGGRYQQYGISQPMSVPF